MSVLWLLLKIFVEGILCVLLIGLLALIFGILTKPLAKISSNIQFICTVIAYPIFLYAWTFISASYFEAIHLSNFNHKWIIYIIGFVFLFTLSSFAQKEVSNKAKEIEREGTFIAESMILLSGYDDKLYTNLIIMTSLRTYYAVLISYIIFLIFRNIADSLYFGVPKYIAHLF
jgi:hypothetical protein